MCEFLSYTEYKGKLYYLTNFELATREGKELRKKLDYDFYEEIKGHGAIKEYFGLPHSKCIDHECTDFSTPDNFPAEIVEKIKVGQFSQIGIAKELLQQPARAEYEKIEQSALAEYRKIQQSAWAEYEKIEQPARAEYEKIEQPALAEYRKIQQSAFWQLFTNPKNRTKVWK